jgi:cellular nucleic acid-binding protein
MVRREEESTAIDELDDSEDLLDEEEEAPWEEPTHITRKRARGRRGGKKVAARPGRDVGTYAEFDSLCLLCTQPGHRATDCTTGPVCLRCGEAGHMARECSLPRQCRRRTEKNLRGRE